jgi:hypothetical protein
VQAALAVVLGLWFALAIPAHAASPHPAWSVEVDAKLGRLILIWPAPTRATLSLVGDVAHMRAERPLAAPPPSSATSPLEPWLLEASVAPDGSALALQMRPDTTARLAQPHPRLTVIEFERAPAPMVLVAPPTSSPAEKHVAVVEPAAGPAGTMPIPRSHPDSVAPSPTVSTALPRDNEVDQPVSQPEQGVTVAASGGADKLELRFRWGGPVPAAMFVRGDQFWAVFPNGAAPVAGWRSLARPEVARWVELITTATAGDARLFRFRTTGPVLIEPRPTVDGWSVQVTASDAPAATPAGSPWTRKPSAANSRSRPQVESRRFAIRNRANGWRCSWLSSPVCASPSRRGWSISSYCRRCRAWSGGH